MVLYALRRPVHSAMSRPQQRLASIQRHLSSTPVRSKEIQQAYILSAVRTPTAVFNGSFLNPEATAPKLGAIAIREALKRSDVPKEKIGHVYMGNVLAAGVGQAPARQAGIFAGLPTDVEATTINKVCASGLKAVSIGAQQIELGQEEAVVAGGMESMTFVPSYVPRASHNPPFGNITMEDGLLKDGLTDVYNKIGGKGAGIHMGNCAENTAAKHSISRKEQDDFAILSYQRAQKAYADGLFTEEIVPVTFKTRKGETTVSEDEQYKKLNLEKLPTLKPAFDKSPSATVTAGNASPLSDGASALILANRALAKQHGKGKRVLARIVSYADAAVDPIDFPVAPAKVVPIALERAGITADQVTVWEFNEAFAAVIKANGKILGIPEEKVNPRGGAIALGHALGSSGSRILVTLLHQLKKGEYGVAAICNGGGAATGLVVQMVDADEL